LTKNPKSIIIYDRCSLKTKTGKEQRQERNRDMSPATTSVVSQLMSNPLTRFPLKKLLEKRVKNWIIRGNPENDLISVQTKKFQFIAALLHCVCNNLAKGFISKKAIKRFLEVTVANDSLGIDQRCNLNCIGCYADAGNKTPATLPYDIVIKILDQVHDVFGRRFVTISGGEPFAYRDPDSEKTILDVFKKYPDMLFLVYTNGTLINEKAAKSLAELGNATPAISVEGFKKETDRRRGKGVFKKILRAFANLREAGVPFGISVTATSQNTDLLLSDEFYDFYFQEQGTTYMWMFQFMPIGRGAKTFKLVVSPEKRVKLYGKWKTLLETKKYCVADFWNSGVLSSGCIAYGREKAGYLYIDWNGNIMPCVFVPCYEDNIYDLFARGKGLVDALFSNLMIRGRQWQHRYGLQNRKHPGNWLMPCSIRDNYRTFREEILTEEAKGEDENAERALRDEEYQKAMEAYDKELRELTEEIWNREYLSSK